MQTAVRALRRGDIGVPLSAQTAMQYVGPDMFHPAPEFLFTTGAGPVVDMGPYYIAALVSLFGPVARVGALGLRGQDTRQVKVGDRAGSSFPVSVPTHVQTIAQFEKGQTSQSVFSFDSPITRMGVLEVIGTEGTLVIPDPNRFTGEVRIARAATNYEGIDEPIWSRCDAVGIESGRGLDLIRALGTEGLSYDRIAARVGVSASTARNVLKRTGRWSR